MEKASWINVKAPEERDTVNKNIMRQINQLSKARNEEDFIVAERRVRLGTLVHIQVSRKLVNSAYSSKSINYYHFHIMIDEDEFPERPPQVTCNTRFVFPSIADGRDLFSAICLKWVPENPEMLKELCLSLPKFVHDVIAWEHDG